MKNRRRYILERNEYDIMLEIAERSQICPIHLLTGNVILHADNKPCAIPKECKTCFDDWLNKETDGESE